MFIIFSLLYYLFSFNDHNKKFYQLKQIYSEIYYINTEERERDRSANDKMATQMFCVLYKYPSLYQ